MRQAQRVGGLVLGTIVAAGLAASAAAQREPGFGGTPQGPPQGAGPPAFSQLPDPPGPFDAHDLSGMWMIGFGDFVDHKTVQLPLTPTYLALEKAHVAGNLEGKPFADSVSSCQAFGMPRVMTFGTAEVFQNARQLTMVTEILHEVRRIYLDGRQKPADFEPSFGGYSVGHWEGDALVVDTTGIVANAIDQYGTAMSDKLTVRERLRRVSPNRLQNEITITDPEALTQPASVTKTYSRMPPTAEIAEFICTQNNRNGPDASGRTKAR